MGNGKTAILVIHGMGDQRPLETLRGVAKAIWEDGSPGRKNVWYTYPTTDSDLSTDDAPKARASSKVDSGSALDSPTIITDQDDPRGIFEFHELYWAPIMARASSATVPLWLFELMKKGPGTLKGSICAAWYIGAFLVGAWLYSFAEIGMTAVSHYLAVPANQSAFAACMPLVVASLAGGMLASLRGILSVWAAAVIFSVIGFLLGRLGFTMATQPPVATWFHWLAFTTDGRPGLWVALTFALLFVIANIAAFQSVLGDAARYYRTSPVNIGARRAVRSLAVNRLEALHKANYDRIIVVSHSLGTVIAYDMLRAYWASARWQIKPPIEMEGFERQNSNAKGMKIDHAIWRQTGHDIIEYLEKNRPSRSRCHGWRVTDFITMGSPLTHAKFLQAEGRNKKELEESFAKKVNEREFPKCPPDPIENDQRLTFNWKNPKLENPIVTSFHQAALFGLTRWTNLYYPAKWLVRGDVVGGPLSQNLLGECIRDVALDHSPLMGHVRYWEDATNCALQALRMAVNLNDDPE